MQEFKSDSSFNLEPLKLFAAIFLDGELGGGPLEGLNVALVTDSFASFLSRIPKDRYDSAPSFIEEMNYHLTKISAFYKMFSSCPVNICAQIIYEQLLEKRDVYFPGGWIAKPAGHLMIYRLFYNDHGDIVFLSYNTGDGSQYHKRMPPVDLLEIAKEDYKETFNPVYAICFPDPKRILQYGGLVAWIKKLVEPCVLPNLDHTYLHNNAKSIYEIIFAASSYLGGQVTDPSPYFAFTTEGQYSGTCAQKATEEMLRGFFKREVIYKRFLLDYRLDVLNQYLITQKIPRTCKKEFQAALAEVARMVTMREELGEDLCLKEKEALVTELKRLNKEAEHFFKEPTEVLSVPLIPDIDIHISPRNWMPGDTSPQSHPSKGIPLTPILLFDKSGSLVDALRSLLPESKKENKAIFVHNIEQLCFTFCEQIKDFKSKPFSQIHSAQEWAEATQLVNRYSVEYFDFYFKNKCRYEIFEYLFREKNTAKRPNIPSKLNYSSPRNQVIALGLMSLIHYTSMIYTARILELKSWHSDLNNLDHYVTYLPAWLLFHKMPRDFFVSSTDPNLTELLLALNDYYKDHSALSYSSNDKSQFAHRLFAHYKMMIHSPTFIAEKTDLESYFNGHLDLFRSNDRLIPNLEKNLLKHQVMALYVARMLYFDEKSPKKNHPTIDALIQTQHHVDTCINFCVRSLTYGNVGNGEVIFDIMPKKDQLVLVTCMTLKKEYADFYQITADSYWQDSMCYGRGILMKKARGHGQQRKIADDAFEPLIHDVMKPHLNSNQIRLLDNTTAQHKIFMDLRTALPLQALQLIDYFLHHMNLLEDRDYQFYLLFSLFQPGIIDLALKHQADLLLAIQQLRQKGIALGDLAQNNNTLTHRGLFLLKINAWVNGYLVSCKTASATIRALAIDDYDLLNDSIDYWLAHDKRPTIQTELQRLAFYNIMRKYSPFDLAQPNQQKPLQQALYARFYIQQHDEDRLQGTVTQTEDESFTPLFLSMQTIDPAAIVTVLPAVLSQLLPNLAPFTLSKQPALDMAYYCVDNTNQSICVDLMNGEITQMDQIFVPIPSLMAMNNEPYKHIVGIDVTPLAKKINENEYQFNWEGNTYYLTPEKLFKQIHQEWYEYETTSFLPKSLRHTENYAWVNRSGDQALIYRRSNQEPIYHWKDKILYSHLPEGIVCFNGDARQAILEHLSLFESPQFIRIILLHPTEKQQYRFYLPRYKLEGYFDEQTGVTIQYGDKRYPIQAHASPLKTGILIGPKRNTPLTECLLLVPVQPFYTKCQIYHDSHFALVHDFDDLTKEVLTKQEIQYEQAYITLHFNALGKLATQATDHSSALYLVYLYCARYDYDKAFALLKCYQFEGSSEELTYLHWLCDKLPAILESQKNTPKGPKPISNSQLLAIQLSALTKFIHLQTPPQPKSPVDDKLSQFFTKLPDYIIKTYATYHPLSERLNDEMRLSASDLAYLANDVWLRLEKTKRAAQKECLSLEREKARIPEKDRLKINAIEKQIREQEKIMKNSVKQQSTGYLAYVYARTSVFPSTETIHALFQPHITSYKTELIRLYWPEKDRLYYPLNGAYDVLLKSEHSTIEPGKLYLECTSNISVAYTFINAAGIKQRKKLYNISLDGVTLDEDTPISPSSLQALKPLIQQDAASEGFMPLLVGTFDDLAALETAEDANISYPQASALLSLDMPDTILLTQLKYYFRLIQDDRAEFDAPRAKLKDFCERTIIACADLNERLRTPKISGAYFDERDERDERKDRLQIAIVLLRALTNPTVFRKAYIDTFKQYANNKEAYINRSIWEIITEKFIGFYATVSSEQDPTLHAETAILKEVKFFIPKAPGIQPPSRILPMKAPKPLKKIELPASVAKLEPILQAFYQNMLDQKRSVMWHFQTLSPLEQRAQYDGVDQALDSIVDTYQQLVQTYIADNLVITDSRHDVEQRLVRLTERLVDSHTSLKRYVGWLPNSLQDLMALNIKQLAAQQLPIDLDVMLNHYAHGRIGDYLNFRQSPTASRHLVRHALNQWLEQVFLYRQYQRIHETLIQLPNPLYPHHQTELRLQLAKHVLELHALPGNAALEVFQYESQKTVRGDQWSLTTSLLQTHDHETLHRVGQLIMGGGKSKVILPLLAFLKADGYRLSTIEVPSALLETSYRDLRQTLKDVFNQELELFSFARNSPCDTISLMSYLAKFRDIVQQKKCLMIAPSSLQSLHLKWRELLYQGQTSDTSPELLSQIDLLNDCLALFKERADVVIDEVHKVLDINQELNYAIGDATTIDPVVIQTTLDLYDFLETLPINAAPKHLLSKLNGLSFLDLLKNPSILHHPPELITTVMAYYEQHYMAFAEHMLQEHQEQTKIRTFLRAQWETFLPLTLKEKLRTGYGPSSSEKLSMAIPYVANNMPSDRFFDNFVTSLNYTTQMCRLEGVNFDTYRTVLKSWKKSDQEILMGSHIGVSEAEHRYQLCLQAIGKTAETLPTQLKDIDLMNEGQAQALYRCLQKNKFFIRYALEESILPSIQLYRHKLTSNAINHANQVYRIQGVTGTPESHPSFDDRMSFDCTTSFGTRNYLKTLLKKKATPLIVQGEENLLELSALIDVGSHKRGKSNIEVAQEIAMRLNGTPIRYVLFFQGDDLCAWKIGGMDQDIIKLPSTDATTIEKCLKVKPKQCFTYYDQSHATGIDIKQAPEACASVHADIDTSLDDFLQAVSRMRLLSGGQRIVVVLSSSLKNKLGPNPILEDLYECLENTGRTKLANKVFKAACKKLYNVVQMDLDDRLSKLQPADSIALFGKFQHLLVDRNSDDILELFGKDIKICQTEHILGQIRDSVLKNWQEATSSHEINPRLSRKCDSIISKALPYCLPTQNTSLDLSTEVNIEQKQEVQVELKVEVKTEVIPRNLIPREIDTSWALHCDLQEDGNLTGSEHNRNKLALLWRNHPENLKKYHHILWSQDLFASTQYYLTHAQQTENTLPKDLALKPILSTLFWMKNDRVHALLVSQEEAEVFAKRLPLAQQTMWLETATGLFLAGKMPNHKEKRPDYMTLKEQIDTLAGNTSLLFHRKELIWFSSQHISLLYEQMTQQGKTDDIAIYKQLVKRFSLPVNESGMQSWSKDGCGLQKNNHCFWKSSPDTFAETKNIGLVEDESQPYAASPCLP